MDVFSLRFKTLKEQKAVTYSHISEYLKIQPRTVKGYAGGTIKPDYFKMIAIADYFGVSIDYLVGRTENPEINK